MRPRRPRVRHFWVCEVRASHIGDFWKQSGEGGTNLSWNLLCPKNKKNFSENFLLKKQVPTRLVYKKKKKTKPLFTKLRLKWQNSAHFVSGKVCLWPRTQQRTLAFGKKTALFCFVFFRVVSSSKFPKWRKQKTSKRDQKFFFLFVKTTMLLCETIKHFLVSQLSKINKPLAIAFGCKKKQLFFLAWEVEKLQKKCEHQRFVTKSNGQFHYFVTPTHPVIIVITNFNVFEHPTTQV